MYVVWGLKTNDNWIKNKRFFFSVFKHFFVLFLLLRTGGYVLRPIGLLDIGNETNCFGGMAIGFLKAPLRAGSK